MVMQRDFLKAPPSEAGPMSQDEALELIRAQTVTLEDILFELQKSNPTVLCQTVVANTVANQIIDTAVHKVTFQVGGKPVRVWRLWVWSTYDQHISYSILSMAGHLDGMHEIAGNTTKDTPNVLAAGIDEAYIKVETLSNNSCYVNGPADSTHGGFFMLGWTTPNYDVRHR